jgi:hypothetical protein
MVPPYTKNPPANYAGGLGLYYQNSHINASPFYELYYAIY